MARPEKTPADRRTFVLAIRLTAAERTRLELAARQAHMSMSAYVRAQALEGRVVAAQHQPLPPDLYHEVRRIGVNLNQLTRLANKTGKMPAGLRRACAAVEDMLIRELDAHSAGSGQQREGAGRKTGR